MALIIQIFIESWRLLQAASVYVLFGVLVAGLLHIFLNPASVAVHLGRGRFWPVFKAALIGIPLPLCSCGVLPAAAALKRQGANNGATTAFLISTPESGVDSMAMTYALLDPIMTMARPVAAFLTAVTAGILTNLFDRRPTGMATVPDLSCPVDNCCDGVDCRPADHKRHHSWGVKIWAGWQYAFIELWGDIAVWFLGGVLLAGLIGALVPPDMLTRYLGGGLGSMLIMLAVGIPLYICATASTPIAAALILKGVSPGAALVFLLAGPATNITSLTVLFKVLGKRAAFIYLGSIAVCSLISGLALDRVYILTGISIQVTAGKAAEWLPSWLQTVGALLLLAFSAQPVYRTGQRFFAGKKQAPMAGCGCHGDSTGKNFNHETILSSTKLYTHEPHER
jgi:hypothetical protein